MTLPRGFPGMQCPVLRSELVAESERPDEAQSSAGPFVDGVGSGDFGHGGLDVLGRDGLALRKGGRHEGVVSQAVHFPEQAA